MDTDDTSAGPARAGAVLEARIETRRTHPLARAGKYVASFALAVLSGGAGDDHVTSLDLVVTRRETGAEVLRVAAGTLEEADRLLAHTRRDLESMSVEEFVRSWRHFD